MFFRETGLSVREATRSDLHGVVLLVSALLTELGGKSLAKEIAISVYAEIVSDTGKGFVLISEAEQTMIAVCTVSHVHALRSHGQYSIIQEMYVKPEFRNGKVGSLLLERTLMEAVSKGSAFVEVGTPIGGKRQENFYFNSAFIPVGKRLRWSP
jgi:GNAT superfamily N-acetyltransferase